MKRAVTVLIVALTVALAATADTIYSRTMDGWSVAWFLLLAGISAIASVATGFALFREFRRRERTTFDQIFGPLFLILPTSLVFFALASSTLCWHFLGWE